MDLLDAALTEPAAVALHAMRQGQVQPGDTVAILGTGPIGMILAQWARYPGRRGGAAWWISIRRKLDMARDLRLGETFNARQGDPVAWVQEVTQGRGCRRGHRGRGSRHYPGAVAAPGPPLGHVVFMGNPSGDVRLPQATISQMLRKELTIRGTWNSSFAALPTNEWRVALDMLAAGGSTCTR